MLSPNSRLGLTFPKLYSPSIIRTRPQINVCSPTFFSWSFTDQYIDFIAYQYFLHVVPTTYIAPRSNPLHTHQYSVTHYTREVDHDRGTPGIFFKFDLDPLAITLHQRTTTFLQLLIRCVGVVGGVFVCMGYAIRITTRAVEVVSGADHAAGIVTAESSGAKVGLRAKWAGSELRSRSKGGKLVPQGSGWTMEGGSGSPYSSYNTTPVTGGFSPSTAPSPFNPHHSMPNTPNPGMGLGYPSSTFGPSGIPPTPGARSATLNSATLAPPSRSPLIPGRSLSSGLPYSPLPTGATHGSSAAPDVTGFASVPATPGASYAMFPASPDPANEGTTNGNGFHMAPPPTKKVVPKKND
jgi:hypothetical protein